MCYITIIANILFSSCEYLGLECIKTTWTSKINVLNVGLVFLSCLMISRECVHFTAPETLLPIANFLQKSIGYILTLTHVESDIGCCFEIFVTIMKRQNSPAAHASFRHLNFVTDILHVKLDIERYFCLMRELWNEYQYESNISTGRFVSSPVSGDVCISLVINWLFLC